MTRNTLGDLNGYLFEQLEALNDKELKEEDLELEIKRTQAIINVSKQVIDNGRLVLDAHKYKDQQIDLEDKTPRMLEG